MAQVKTYQVTVRFTTVTGVNVQRTIPVVDTFRSNAVARALRAGIPGDATKVALVSAK